MPNEGRWEAGNGCQWILVSTRPTFFVLNLRMVIVLKVLTLASRKRKREEFGSDIAG